MLTTVLDLLGVVCLAVFAWCIWPPAALLVLGVACVAVSARASRS